MIYIIMHGRLGNQMFQYAFAKMLQKERGDQIAIYFKDADKQGNANGWGDDLQYFNVGDYKVLKDKKFLLFKTSLVQKLKLIVFLFRSKLIRDSNKRFRFQEKQQQKINSSGLYWLRNGDFDPVISKAKNIFISGHFENYKFYLKQKEELFSMFTPKETPLESNQELYEIEKNTESVCISIRRGDFLDKKNINTYYLCDKNYFDSAIAAIKERIKNPVFIVFSDDVDWVRENYVFEGTVYFETPNNPVWEKLRLMYNCKHFIISNSTFSWWTQFLSRNNDKIVVSPSRWKNGSAWRGLIDGNFVQIDV